MYNTNRPKYFLVKRNTGVSWKMYLQWLQQTYNLDEALNSSDTSYSYIGYINNPNHPMGLGIYTMGDTLPTVRVYDSPEEFFSMLYKKAEKNNDDTSAKSIPYNVMKKIYDATYNKLLIQRITTPFEETEITLDVLNALESVNRNNEVFNILKENNIFINKMNFIADKHSLFGEENSLISLHKTGTYAYKSFYLNNEYNWKVISDNGSLILITHPKTKKAHNN